MSTPAGEDLEQADDATVGRDVDLLGRRELGEPRHRHDVARERHDEAGAGGHPEVAHGDAEAARGAELRLIVRERVLRLRHADGQIAVAEVLELLELLGGGAREVDAVGVVDLRGDGVQLAGTSSLAKSAPAGAIMLGTPAETQREFMVRHTLPKKVEKLKSQIAELEKRIAELEKK